MRALLVSAVLVFSGCGLEQIFENIGHLPVERPASKLVGKLQFPTAVVTVTDADGKAIDPFQSTINADGTFDIRLPSANYSNLVMRAVSGNTALRALIPSIGQESSLTVNVDSRSTAEALITEARLSADKSTWKKVTPVTYLATAALIQAGFDTPGPTADLLAYVNLLVNGAADPSVSGDPVFFATPVLKPDFTVTTSPLDNGWLDRTRFDYVGDGKKRADSKDFDAKLATVAQLYRPAGCPDPDNVRIVFTVNFNSGILNGNCGSTNRFNWAVDKPGKSMFFVGWIHKDSANQDPLVNALLGAGVPNQLPMHDDGQAGDEVAGDNIWTIYFDVPRDLRLGYKYTWGFRGGVWTGSEEWPGNSRIIQATEINGDGIIYRRDVFGDEATNKDRSNLNNSGTGSLEWDTVLRKGWGIEAREQQVDLNQDCTPDMWVTPTSVGPLTLACTQ